MFDYLKSEHAAITSEGFTFHNCLKDHRIQLINEQ